MREMRTNSSESNELKHYGVMGMRWGVRKGKIGKVNTKATKQIAKYDAKIAKQAKKISKASAKYNRYSNARFFRDSRYANKWKNKLKTAQYKQEKTARKGAKFVTEMSKTMKESGYKPSAKHVEAGKRYTKMVNNFNEKRIDSVYYPK